MSEQGALRTWFSGNSSPEDSKGLRGTLILAGLIFFVVSPISVLIALICYLLFSKGRVSHKVIAGFTGVITLLLTATTLLFTSIAHYTASIGMIVDASNKNSLKISDVLAALWTQLPLSIVLGGVIGSVYCWWRWIHRPEWEEFQFRLSPIRFYLKRKRIKDIREDKNPPRLGARLGITHDGREIIQSDKEAAAHTLYFGASGSGKTTTMMTQIRDHIRRGHGVVVIDLKGSREFAEVAYEYATRYGRRFQHWGLFNQKNYHGPASEPSFYDPLGRGDASRRKDMVINMRNWSDDYYKTIASSYLQTAFDVMIATPAEPGVDAMSDIISLLLDPATLVQRAVKMPKDPHYEQVRDDVWRWTGGIDPKSGRLQRKLEKTEVSAVEGVARELQNIKGSTAGRWLKLMEDEEKNIDLLRASQRGDVIVFTLDALTYPNVAPLIANLVIEDLKTVTADLLRNPSRDPMHVFIDEFSALHSEGIIGLINKSRSAGMPITLSTQALGDLRRVDTTFLEQLLGIVNSFVIHRANTLADAEVIAGLIGQTEQWNVRLGVEQTSGMFGSVGKGAATGTGMVDKKMDFIIPSNEIQLLGPGEIIYLAKSPRQRIERVVVIPERENLTPDGTEGVRDQPEWTFEPETVQSVKKYYPTPIQPADGAQSLIDEPTALDTPTQQEWDYEKNFPLTPQMVTLGSNKKVWWICSTNSAHKWEARISDRSSGKGCPICVGIVSTPEQESQPVITQTKPSTGFLEGRDIRKELGGEHYRPRVTEPTLFVAPTKESLHPTPKTKETPLPRPTRPAAQEPVQPPDTSKKQEGWSPERFSSHKTKSK